MTIYWVETCFLKPGKKEEYEKWLKTRDAKRVFDQIKKETGFRYLNAYFVLYGIGEYHCEDWWVGPNWAAVDKWGESKAVGKWASKVFGEFRDDTKPYRARVMEAARVT